MSFIISGTPNAAGWAAGRQIPTPRMSAWCFSRTRRVVDVVGTLLVLVPALPLMLLIGLLIKATSRGPLFFSHRRVGRDGRMFRLLKFRTMYHRPRDPGIALTHRGDPRVTPLGKLLRRSKLDELPQFFNVLSGDMGLVGPRPDTPEYYSRLAERQRAVLQLRPGITSVASLRFRNEEELLATFPPAQLEHKYITELLPQKVWLELEYARSASLLSDLLLLVRTAAAIFQ